MKLLTTALILSTSLLIADCERTERGSAAAAQSTPTAETKIESQPADAGAIDSDCRQPKFHNLNRYRGDNWFGVFRDREVAPALKRLLQRDYRKLTANMQRVIYPDSLAFVDGKGVLTLTGFVPQLFTISEAMLVVEPCGNIYAAVLEDGERFLYFSNDVEYSNKLPPAVERWRAGIEKARSDNYRKPELPVVFKSQ